MSTVWLGLLLCRGALGNNKVSGKVSRADGEMAPSAPTNKFGKLITRFGYLAFIITFSITSKEVNIMHASVHRPYIKQILPWKY